MKPLRALHYIMGTLLDCTLFDVPAAQGRCLLSQGVHEVRRLERLLSLYDADSALSRLNRQAGCGPVQVAPELWQLLCLCAALTQQTNGTFDVSAGALACHEPTALSRVSGHILPPAFGLSADCRVELAPGACLDLGGIGKGYAVDRLSELFQTVGVSRAFINFGESSLYTLGKSPLQRHGVGPFWYVVWRRRKSSVSCGVSMARSPPRTVWGNAWLPVLAIFWTPVPVCLSNTPV